MRSAFWIFVAAGLVFAAGFAPTSAQIPDKYTNLKVLPQDISKQELVAIMRSFAGGLGVRCNHCHVGGTERDLTGMDFASDEKKEKKIAREMLRMVNEINGTLIKRTGIENPIQVKCATCHHGVEHPQSLAAVTKKEYEKGGFEAAKTNYLALKEKYYGADAYDFRSRTLNEVAEWLAEERDDVAGAVAVMQFNIELEPTVAYSHNLLGRIQLAQADTTAAVASLRKAIELDPKDEWSKKLLEKLGAK